MTLTLHIEANSLGELRLEVCRALSLLMPDAPAQRVEGGDSTIGQTGPLPGERAEPEQWPIKRAEPAPEPTKPRRAHRATKPVTVPKPGDEPVQEPEEPFEVEMPEPEDPGPDEKDIINGADPVAAEALKKQVIEQLAGLFTAGKVKVVRHVLDKYGQGAKSFPEIDASQFPAIRDAIARGETA